MKATLFILLSLVAIVLLVATVFEWSGPSASDPPNVASLPKAKQGESSAVIAAHGQQPPKLAQTPTKQTDKKLPNQSSTAQQVDPMAAMERRIAQLETQVKSLQHALSGVSLEKASADRQKLFAADEGYLKADEYAAAGQHAIAGEGYLTFLQHHPQHPDAKDVMKKARDSFLKAGYKDKAFWVQDEMMKGNPQHQLADLEELAHIEKDAELYDRAMQHMDQAAQLDANPESRLWKRMYWAWFVQLQNGNAEGLTALQQVQQEIAASGVNNPKLNQRLREHATEWQQQLSSQR